MTPFSPLSVSLLWLDSHAHPPLLLYSKKQVTVHHRVPPLLPSLRLFLPLPPQTLSVKAVEQTMPDPHEEGKPMKSEL